MAILNLKLLLNNTAACHSSFMEGTSLSDTSKTALQENVQQKLRHIGNDFLNHLVFKLSVNSWLEQVRKPDITFKLKA